MAARLPMNSCLLILLIVLQVLSGCNRERVETVTIAGETFSVELAVTEEARAQGMSGRDSFPEGGVMLFVFPDAKVRSFWMIDCIIDMDIIFLDPRGFITATHRMKAEPPKQPGETQWAYEDRLKRYSSVRPAQFAIELPAGSLDRLRVGVDDRIILDFDRLKAMAESADAPD